MGYPVLSDLFFKNHRPNSGFFSKWKDAGPWNQNLIPLYEWQGILYVGVSETKSLKFEPHWCLVQANSELMKNLWIELNSTPAEFTLEDNLSSSGEDSPEPMNLETESDGAPEGMDLGPTTFGSQTVISDLPPNPAPEFSDEAPDGFLVQSTAPPAPLATSSKPEKTATQGPALSSHAEPEDFDWKQIWEKVMSEYEHGIVFLTQQGSALPWKWDPTLKNPESQQPYAIEKPSPFRIVQNTHKPYHGYLIKNDVSSQLFKDWNNGFYPDHLTVSPIIVRESLVGFFMAWGKKPNDSKKALQLIEVSASFVGDLLAQTAGAHKAA